MTVKLHLVKVALAAVGVAAVVSCGHATSTSSALQTANDGQLVPGKLFYDMPLYVHKANFVHDPHGPADDSQAGWTVAVEPVGAGSEDGPADSYQLKTTWDHNNFGYGFSSLNLTTGTVHTHAIHSYDFSYLAPEAQGDITPYLPVIDEMIQTARLANATADVTAYLQYVKDHLLAGQYNSQRVLDKQNNVVIKAGQSNTFKVAYTAIEPRDLIVRLFDEDAQHDWRTFKVATGRTTVQPGSGTAEVTVTAPSASISGSRMLCVDSLTVKAGAPEPQADIVQNNFCLPLQ